MTTLLESGARPYGSSKGMVVSMLTHGGLIALAVFGTTQVVLPPREKVEEHPILYVAPPPPKEIHMDPAPLPKLKEPPPKAKDNKVFRAPPPPKQQAPQPQKPTPAPAVQPKGPTVPALTAPVKLAVNIPPVDLKATPTISDVVAPPAPEKMKGGVSGEGTVKSSDGDVEGGRKGGLGSGASDNKTYDENTVERAVQVTRAAAPRYPDALKSVGVEGTVVMRFIVGTDGRVEGGSFEVVSSPNNLFSEAVKNALRNTRYRAAEANGHSVRQLVEQSFTFRLDKSGG